VVGGRNGTAEDVSAHDFDGRLRILIGHTDDAVDGIVRGNDADVLRAVAFGDDEDGLWNVRAVFVNLHVLIFGCELHGFGDVFGHHLFGSFLDARKFPTFDLDGELLLFVDELLLPALFVAGHFLNGLQILEAARVGAGRFGFVAVEEMHFVEVGLDPVGGVGLAGVESLFIGVDGALAAEENPEVVDGAGDQSSVVVKRGLILLEEVFEEREEVGRVLVCEEQRLRSAAVLQVVHAGGEFTGESSGAALISHGLSFEARVGRFTVFGR